MSQKLMMKKNYREDTSQESATAGFKKLTNKRQIIYTWINFILLMVIFVVTIAVLFYCAEIDFVKDADDYISKYSSQYYDKEIIKEGGNGLPVGCYIMYYNSDGNLMSEYGNGRILFNHMGQMGVINKHYSVKLAGEKFRVYTVKRDDDSYLKVTINVEGQYKVYQKLMKYVTIYAPIATVLLFFVSLALAYNQVKPYQQALDSSLTFTSNVAHELNTPMSIVKANLENILESDFEQKYSTQLSVCLSEVDRLKRLTSQLLLLSRSDNKRLVYVHKDVNIKNMIEDIAEPYQIMADDQDKIFLMHFGVAVDEFYSIDKDLYHQILIALLDNAIKYTVAGEKIVVNARVHRAKFIMTISDNGAGVEDEELDKIFVRFYRSEKSRTSQGTGLGLPIVHAIVSSLGGKVQANNLTPRGFSVTISVPLVDKLAEKSSE